MLCPGEARSWAPDGKYQWCDKWWLPQSSRAAVLDELRVPVVSYRDAVWPNRTAPPPELPRYHWQGDSHPDDPRSVAPLAVYLASEAAGDVNGQLFGVRAGEVYLYTHPGIDRQILSYGRRFTMDELDEQAPRALAFGASSPLRSGSGTEHHHG